MDKPSTSGVPTPKPPARKPPDDIKHATDEKIPLAKGRVNDGFKYERKVMMYVAASLSRDDSVRDFWMVNNPKEIDSFDDAVLRVTFKDGRATAVLVQVKLTKKALFLELEKPEPESSANKNDKRKKGNKMDKNKKSSRKKNEGDAKNKFPITLWKYKTDSEENKKNIQSEKSKLYDIFKDIDMDEHYYCCIFSSSPGAEPKLQINELTNSPLRFMDASIYNKYHQFDYSSPEYDDIFYKQLYLLLKQPDVDDIDSALARHLGDFFTSKNIDELDRKIKSYMFKSDAVVPLTKNTFGMLCLEVFVEQCMVVDFPEIKKIDEEYIQLWMQLYSSDSVINVGSFDQIRPLLGYFFQQQIRQKIHPTFTWGEGIESEMAKVIKEKYGKVITNERELIILLWQEEDIPLAIDPECTQIFVSVLNIYEHLNKKFMIFSDTDIHAPLLSDTEVINNVGHLSSWDTLRDILEIKLSLQGRTPVRLADIAFISSEANLETVRENMILHTIKISQLLIWTTDLNDSNQNCRIIGEAINKPASSNWYIKRNCFTEDEEEISEEEMYNTQESGLWVIFSEPGMGKSDLLWSLSYNHISAHSVLVVNMRDCFEEKSPDRIEVFRWLFFKDTVCSTSATCIDYLISKAVKNSDELFDCVLKTHVQNNRWALYIDAYDELLPDQVDATACLLEKLQSEKEIPIFITSRFHDEVEIPDASNIIPLYLMPFSDDDIVRYCRLRGISRSVLGNFEHVVLSNPLYLNMIASTCEETSSVDNIGRAHLYANFIQQKLKSYCKKEKMTPRIANITCKESVINHRKAAMLEILGYKFAISQGLIQQSELEAIAKFISNQNLGLAVASTSKSTVYFLHRSYGEYFLADWLYYKCKDNEKFPIIYCTILENDYYREVYSMFNEISCELNAHKAVILGNTDALSALINNHDNSIFLQDEFGRTIAHILAWYSRFSQTHKNIYKQIMESHMASEFLLIRDEILNYTVKDFEGGPKQFTTWSEDDYKLINNIQSGFKSAVKHFFISHPDRVYADVGTIALHKAIIKGRIDMVQLFLDFNADLLQTDVHGNNALHVASAFGNMDIIKLILSKIKDVNDTNLKGQTAVQLATECGRVIMDKVNYQGSGTSKKYLPVLQLLLENGAVSDVLVENWEVTDTVQEVAHEDKLYIPDENGEEAPLVQPPTIVPAKVPQAKKPTLSADTMIPFQAGNLNEGLEYQRKVMMYAAAALSQDDNVQDYWVVSNPKKINSFGQVVMTVSFKKGEAIALFVQVKLSEKVLELKKLEEKYMKDNFFKTRFTKNNSAEESEKDAESKILHKVFENINKDKHYFCIFTNSTAVPEGTALHEIKKSYPVQFMNASNSNCHMYSKSNDSNNFLHKQLYLLLGQPDDIGMDSSLTKILGKFFTLNNINELNRRIKNIMIEDTDINPLRKKIFENICLEVLVEDDMLHDFPRLIEIDDQYIELWMKLYSEEHIINIHKFNKIRPLLGYFYQKQIQEKVDPTFSWDEGITNKIKQVVSDKYGKSIASNKELIIVLWQEENMPLAIKPECTQNFINVLKSYQHLKKRFIIFSDSDVELDTIEVINYVGQLSNPDTLKDILEIKVSLQGRSPVRLTDIACIASAANQDIFLVATRDSTFLRIITISQLLYWTTKLNKGNNDTYSHRTIGRNITKPESSYIKRNLFLDEKTFTEYGLYDVSLPSLLIISGESGMGKSVLLESVAYNGKPNNIVVFVHLRNCMDDLDKVDFEEQFGANAINYFVSKTNQNVHDKLIHGILDTHIANNRWRLLLDGYDDILPHHRNKVIRLLQKVLSRSKIEVFLTTRHYENVNIDIATRTRYMPIIAHLTLLPFSKDDVHNYCRSHGISIDLVNHFEHSFVCNPLHLNMIASVSKNNPCENIFGKAELYKRFIEQKHLSYFGVEGTTTRAAEITIEKSLECHRKIALLEVFGKEFVNSQELITLSELETILQYIAELNLGLATVSTSKLIVQFLHRPYAEYFVGSWLYEFRNNDKFATIYRSVLDNSDYREVFNIFNEIAIEKSSRLDKSDISMPIKWLDKDQDITIDIMDKDGTIITKDLRLKNITMETLAGMIQMYDTYYNTEVRIILKVGTTLKAHKAAAINDIYSLVDFINNHDSSIFLVDDFGRNIAHILAWCSRYSKSLNSIYQQLMESHIASAFLLRKDTVLKYTNKHYEGEADKLSPVNDDVSNLLLCIDSGDGNSVEKFFYIHYELLNENLGFIAFHSAIIRERIDIVQLFLDLNVDLLQTDANGNNSLHVACAVPNIDIIKLILAKISDVNKTNEKNQTAFFLAAGCGCVTNQGPNERSPIAQNYIPVLQLLLDKGANPHTINDDGDDAIHMAAKAGDMHALEFLTQHIHYLRSNNNGWTAFHFAASAGHSDIIALLMDKYPTDVNRKDNKGNSAILLASITCHWEIVDYLLDYNVDCTQENIFGWTPLHRAIVNGEEDDIPLVPVSQNGNFNNVWIPLESVRNNLGIIEKLVEKGADVNYKPLGPLTLACMLRSDIVPYLLSKGADPNQTHNGWSCLMLAAARGDLHTVELLAMYGANASHTTTDGLTAVAVAYKSGHDDVVMFLVRNGCDALQYDDEGWTTLHRAAGKGHLDIVELLVARGIDVNFKTRQGATPLILACYPGKLKMVECLHNNGGDLLLPDNAGWTALHWASFYGHIDIVKYLVEKGMDVNHKTNEGRIALHLASENGHLNVVDFLVNTSSGDSNANASLYYASQKGYLEIVKLLVKKETIDLTAKNAALGLACTDGHFKIAEFLIEEVSKPLQIDGVTLLFCATAKGYLEIAKLLIENGVDVNFISDRRGHSGTALQIALYFGHLNIVQYLLESDKCLEADKNGWNPLHMAASDGHLHLVKLLLEKNIDVNQETKAGDTPLNLAVNSAHFNIVKYILNNNGNPSQSDEDGWNPLHTASSNGNLKIVKLLVEQGIDINCKTNTDDTALNLASNAGHFDVVVCLLSNDADPLQTDEDGFNPLHSAASKGHLEIVKVLSQKMIGVNDKTSAGDTALNLAASFGHFKVVEYLVNNDADLSLADEDGWSPLHGAADKGHLEIVQMLVDKQIDVNSQTKTGDTALNLASKSGHINIVEYLLQHGADPRQSDIDGWNALHLAANYGHLELVECLVDKVVDVNERTKAGITALNLASSGGYLTIVQFILNKGGNPSESDTDGWAPLHSAAWNGHIEIVQLLIQNGSDANKKTCKGNKAHRLATQRGHTTVARHLNGIAPNSTLIKKNDIGN